MYAKKCDVCGALYMLYNDKTNCNKPNGFRLLREDRYFNLHILSRYDCCPDCMSKIQEFVESLDVDNGCSSLAKAEITLGKD